MIRTASICTIGDEILIGQVLDTNSHHISRILDKAGVKVSGMISVPDDKSRIIRSIEDALLENDIVVVTGGLGPTKDDITKVALAELSHSEGYRTDERQLEIIRRILSSRGLDVLDINIAQASVPDTSEVILNEVGTAPVMVFRFPKERFGHEATLYSLPGVPFEALAAMDKVVDDISAHYDLPDITHRTIMTYGMAESALSKLVAPWEDALPPDFHLAYLPDALTGVRLRLSVYGGDRIENERRLDAQIAGLKAILGDVIYSEQDDTLEHAIGALLTAEGKTLSVAESCTGGMISSLLTSVPGSSEYYKGSVTSYSNEIKMRVLGVSEEILNEYGAVSAECVAAMAEGVRRVMNTDYAVATSGVAGPGGGTDEKPVGLVWVGVCSERSACTLCFRFNNDRKRNVERFSSSALHLLLKTIRTESKLLK